MSMSDIEWEIREMLRQGRTYREIAEALNVSFTTIRRVKKELELEEAILRFFGQLKQRFNQKHELRRVWRELERLEALPTEDKLVSLWSLWSKWEEDVRFSLLLDKLFNVSMQGLELWMSAYLQSFNSLFNILVTLATPVIPTTYAMGGYGGTPLLLSSGRVT